MRARNSKPVVATVGKSAVVGTMTRKGGKVQARHVNDTDGETLTGVRERHNQEG